MKRNPYTIFIKGLVYLMLLALLFVSCKQQKQTYLFKKIQEKWFGNWVVKSLFDSIAAHDTITTNNYFSLKNNNASITEFVIQKNLSDSVFFNNEDVENWYDVFSYVSADTLLTKDSICFVYDNSNQTIAVRFPKKSLKSVFFKAPSSMLYQNNTDNNETIKTAFRKMFNTEFHKYSYIIADSFRTNHSKKYVTFFADEKVKGLPNFSHYHMNLNGDANNVEDAISLTLKTQTSEEQFGLKSYGDSIELFRLQLETKNGEKPMYKINERYVTLIKQKWN